MRISAINIFILSVSAGAFAYSTNAKGQSIENTTVELEFVNAPLKLVFAAIEQQTEFSFVVPLNEVDVKHRVNLQAGTYTVKDGLDLVLKRTGIRFDQTGNYIIIFPKSKKKDDLVKNTYIKNKVDPFKEGTSVELLTGTVKDANSREPLAGVNIIVKGTTRGTTTDVEGRFAIEASSNEILIFSFIGFKTLEMEVVEGRSTIDVALEVEVGALKEVVINAGYYDVKQKEKTGNISRVEGKIFETQQLSSPLQALQGRMPGVFVSQNSGVPGAGFSIQIRGQNSLRNSSTDNGNRPLYIIDGVPYTSSSPLLNTPELLNVGTGPNPLSAINPYDIESIEVLKDADATSIYGSRGANGVVLITTKRASSGATKFNVNISQGLGQVPNRVSMLNTNQYISMRNEAFANDNLLPGLSDYDINGTWDQTRDTNWQDVFLGGTAATTNINSSLGWGNASTKFLITGGYYKETTVFPGDMFYQKGSGKFNIDHTTDDQKFNFNLTSTVVAENNNLSGTSMPRLIYELPPNAPALYDENGDLNWENGTWENPLAVLEREYESNVQNLINSAIFSYKILTGLQIKADVGYNILRTKSLNLSPISSKNPFASAPSTGSASFANTLGSSWIVEPQTEYRTQIKQSSISVLIGSTFQENKNEYLFTSISNVENDALLQSISAAPDGSVLSSNSNTQYKYSAVFARINYGFKEKYLLNLTGRRDGSSRFGPGHQFANFGAVGFAWIFSKEGLIKGSLPSLSFGKLRTSYGSTGSDQIGDYGYLDTYEATGFGTGEYLGPNISPTGLANPDYAWEVNKKYEAAMELGFLNDRIFFSSSYYMNRSSNQLVGLPLPATTGFSSLQYNLPATVQNTGLEFELNSTIITAKNLQWTTGVNISFPRTRLIEYPNISASPYALTYAVGEPLSILVGYEFLGVNPQTGLYQFNDVDQDGLIAETDRRPVLNRGIDFYGGVQNSIHYRGVKLDFFIQFVKTKTASYRLTHTIPGFMGNQPIEVLNRWHNPGDATGIQRYSTRSAGSTPHSRWILSDDAYEDGSYAKIRNVTLSWTMAGAIAKRAGLKNSMIYLQAQNLFTITKYKGLDPETRGVSLPVLRIISFGLQLTL